jgi:hypothetical protein
MRGPLRLPQVAMDRSSANARGSIRVPGATRALAALLLACLGLWAGLSGTRGGPSGLAPRAPDSGALAKRGLSPLPIAASVPVSAALGAADPAYRVRTSAAGLRAATPAQRLRLHFTRAATLVSSGSAVTGLSLRSLGYGSAQRSVGEVVPTAAGNRALYAHAGVQEWYVNGPLGLEQGYTLPRAPSGDAHSPLTLAIALSGNTRASLSSSASSIALVSGGSSLRYGQLTVTDAHGRKLPSRLALRGRTILLRVDARGARYPLVVDPLIQQGEKLTAAGGAAGDMFGLGVALSADGNTALVTARYSGGSHGAAWVFTRAGSAWTQQAQLNASGEGSEECVEEGAECSLGRGVALSADGNTALIGAPQNHSRRGSALVFVRTGSSWAQQGGELTASDETAKGVFGRSVALSADGSTALIGGSADHNQTGAAWVFVRAGSSWSQQGTALTGAGETGAGYFGRSVALSADGGTALVGGPGDAGSQGAAWVFKRAGSTWAPSGSKLTGGEELGNGRFGYSVALSADARTAMVGGRSDNEGLGAAWVFVGSGTVWAQQGAKLTGGEETGSGEFGFSVALSADASTALIGGPRDSSRVGGAWVFKRAGESWGQQEAKLVGLQESGKGSFGTSAALSANGRTGLIGGYQDNGRIGAAWAFADDTPLPPPSVAGISPSSGTTAGGTPVTITGSGFLPGATVTIGSPATDVVFVSETELTATTGATAASADEVVVQDANGISTGGPSFTYVSPPPVVTAAITAPPPALGVLGSTSTQVPPPTLGVTGNLEPVSGLVLVKLPGSHTFVALTSIRQVPFGTVVDSTHGSVTLTTEGLHARIQTINFHEGEFKMTQSHNGEVLSTLLGGSFAGCPARKTTVNRDPDHDGDVDRAVISSKRSHTVRKLWASGKGSYSTKGNYATGAVLGTTWLTEDRCDGTLIRVLTDKVAVTNLRTHRRVVVTAGHSLLVKAP